MPYARRVPHVTEKGYMSSSVAVKHHHETPPAQQRTKRQASTLPLVAPSVIALLLWMIVPLVMTVWFSFQRYNLLNPLLSLYAEEKWK